MSSAKEAVWKAEYLKCLNANEAARRAGYKWPEKIGPRKKAKFADWINQKLEEKALEADEILARFGNMARGFDPLEYLEVLEVFDMDLGGEKFLKGIVLKSDFDRMKADGYGWLVKKIKNTSNGIEIEIYDAQYALDKLARVRAVEVRAVI